METGACMRLPFALELCTGTNGFAEKLHHPRIWSIRSHRHKGVTTIRERRPTTINDQTSIS
jgi:hypothetical protein